MNRLNEFIFFGAATTANLEQTLKSTTDIKTFLQENSSDITDPTLQEYLHQLLSLTGLKRQDVIKNAYLDSNYINQLFNGIKTKPGRNQILSLAFGFGLNFKDTDRLLKIAGTGALYPKNKRDAVIIYALENRLSIMEAEDILSALGLEGFVNNAS